MLSAAAFDLPAWRVGDLVRRSTVSCAPGTPIREVARQLAEKHASAALVLDTGGQVVGMVTHGDLATRILAAGLPPDTRVDAVMSGPVVTVDADAYFYEAVQAMLRHRLNHVVILEQGALLGVLAEVDLLAARSRGPIPLARQIADATSLEELSALQPRRVQVLRHLLEAGVGVLDIARMTAELNDYLAQRVLEFVEAQLGPPPLSYCWLGLGSEGRREQTLKTDQDNALVYDDPSAEQVEDVGRYFGELAVRSVAALEACGFPRCRGQVNADNSRWCQPLRVWRTYFNEWVNHPRAEALLNSAIFFDLRAVVGEARLADALWSDLAAWLPRSPLFIRLMLRETLTHRPTGGLRTALLIDPFAEGRSGFDFKWHGLMPIVEPARVFALARGVTQTNTAARLEALCELGEMSRRDADDLVAAYDFILGLRMRHHLMALEAGNQPEDVVAMDKLGRVESVMLREHCKVVAHLQGCIQNQLQLSIGA